MKIIKLDYSTIFILLILFLCGYIRIGLIIMFIVLFHELGHCKSDYNEGKNKVIIDGNDLKEEKADKFALEVMIPEKIWKKRHPQGN